jgi:hypothetical protein
LVTHNADYLGPRDTNAKALICAKDGDGRSRARLIFKENGADLPHSSESVSQSASWCRIWYHIYQYTDVIAILKNGDPVWVYYRSPTFAQIFTGSKHTGEEELISNNQTDLLNQGVNLFTHIQLHVVLTTSVFTS